MTRRVLSEGELAARHLETNFLQGKTETRKRSKPRASTKAAPLIKRAVAEIRERVKTGAWEDLTPSALVGLHAFFHEKAYGGALSMTKNEWLAACGQAKRRLASDFDGDEDAVIEFVKWAWTREYGREKWRRENDRQGRLLSWKDVFATQWLVTEYRVDRNRRHGRAG